LWTKALGDIKNKDALRFSTLKGNIVGENVSISLHMYCHTDTVASHLSDFGAKIRTDRNFWPSFKATIIPIAYIMIK
jgi:hypothetical protein